MADEVSHPIFARLYALSSRADSASGEAELRREMLADARGRVIEVGAGNGLNFRHYPPAVTGVLAIEPEPYLRAKAQESAREVATVIEVVDGVADRIPAEDASFDVAVCSLVLCTVPDQARALAELRRVIRPGGELRFFEHVLSASARFARLQRAVVPAWKLLAGGCRPDRDTEGAIEAAGFRLDRVRRFDFTASPLEYLAKPRIVGSAVRVGD